MKYISIKDLYQQTESSVISFLHPVENKQRPLAENLTTGYPYVYI